MPRPRPPIRTRVAYAKDRLQGRAVTGAANPAGPADPLIVHPDIRRNLMDQKSFVEGARALTFWGAHLIDRAHAAGDEAAEGLISLLTPVIKGFLTDKGFEMAVQAQQVFGGHGYIEEQGDEPVRPRCPHRHDLRRRERRAGAGSGGPQAGADGGKHVMAFFEMVKAESRPMTATTG
jgi:alkylation response protein AidB-like acyl-CoA dehydrogenase